MAGIDSSRFRSATRRQTSSSYGDEMYWNRRYAETHCEPFEWYVGWAQLKEIVAPLLTPEAKVLIVGCGSSSLGEHLYADGFVNVMNVDRCIPLIDALSEKHQDKGTLQYEAEDALKLPAEWAATYDVVIDKALLDSLACSVGKWKVTRQLLESVCQVLKPSGTYICVSHCGPDVRRHMLMGRVCQEGEDGDVASERFGWQVFHHPVVRPLTSPVVDPKAKDKMELIPGPLFNEKDYMYHVYVCKRSKIQ